MIDKIFVCHHNLLVDRKVKLQSFFDKNNIDVEWIEDFLPEELENNYEEIVGSDELKNNPIKYNISSERYSLFSSLWFDHIKDYMNGEKKVTLSELSLYLKHKKCFEEQIKNQYEYILILEDDVILPNNFLNYINSCIFEFKHSSPTLDCLIIGTCCGFKSKNIKNGKLIYYDETNLTRCTNAIMYTLNASKKIYNRLYPINWPIDFKLNEIIVMENLKVGWVEPPLYQESDLDLSKSTIQKSQW